MSLWPRRRRGWRRCSWPARRACSTSVSSPGTGRPRFSDWPARSTWWSAARRTGWTARAAGSERLIPTDGQADRRADEADHAVGLDEVAPLLAGPGVDVLGQEAVPIAAGQHVLEQATLFLPPPQGGDRGAIPEPA